MSARFRTSLFVLWAACVLLVPFHGDYLRKQPIGAFGAFYCAGTTLRAGGDPYRVEPLRSCERRLPGYPEYLIDGVVEPAPLPGYALVPFVPLSLLPFKAAFILFSALSVLATIVAVIALGRLTGLPILVIGAALLLGDLFRNLIFGEVPSIVIGALSLAALLIVRKRPWAASVALGVALIEPHVTLPALLAVGIALPWMRKPLLALVAILILLSFATTGMNGPLEYATRVLPVQAAAELPASDQYSLSWILNLFGIDDRIALLLGSLSYGCAVALGVVLGLALTRRCDEPAYAVFLPPAVAMIGGSFLHDIQIPIALPAALLLFARMPVGRRAWGLATVLALAVPWASYGKLTAFAVPVVVAIVAAGSGLAVEMRDRVAAALGAVVAVMLLFVGLQRLSAEPFHPVGHLPASIAEPADARGNASEIWARYVRVSGYGTSSPRSIAEKLPLWGGLLGVACAAGLLVRRRCRAGGPGEAFPV